MKSVVLKKKLNVFTNDGEETVTIDKVTLVVSPARSYLPMAPSSDEVLAHATAQMAERFGAVLEWTKGRCFSWEEASPPLKIQQYIGDTRRGDGRRSVSQVVFANPLRTLQALYEQRGMMRALIGDADNVVYPSRILPARISFDVFDVMQRIVSERLEQYAQVHDLVFARQIPRECLEVLPDGKGVWAPTGGLERFIRHLMFGALRCGGGPCHDSPPLGRKRRGPLSFDTGWLAYAECNRLVGLPMARKRVTRRTRAGAH